MSRMNSDPAGQGQGPDQQPDEGLEITEQAAAQQLPPAVDDMAAQVPPVEAMDEPDEAAAVSPTDPAVEWGTKILVGYFAGQRPDVNTRQRLVELLATNEEMQVTLWALLWAGSQAEGLSKDVRDTFAGLFDRLTEYRRRHSTPQQMDTRASTPDEGHLAVGETPIKPPGPTE